MYRKLKNEELNRLSQEEYRKKIKHPVIVVLDDIRSAYNVGSVFRTADAFLVESIYLCGFTPAPPQREIQKTALGANETVSWKYFASTLNAIDELKKNNYKIVVVEQAENSRSLADFRIEKNEKIALVLGNEIGGVLQQVVDASDACIEIPQYGTKHSLNIAVCAGIILWEISRQINRG